MNENYARNTYTGLIVVALLVIIVGAATMYLIASSSAGRAQAGGILPDTISVSGTGTVTMDPDEVLIYLGVQTQSASVLTAQQENAQKMDKIIKAIKDAGIAPEDIETTSYSMYPLRDYEKAGQPITGYVVSNQLKVTVKETDKAGEIIDDAVAAGVNEVQSVIFTLSDEKRKSVRDEAIEKAMEAARSDADAMAKAAGVTLKGPLQMSTSDTGIVIPYPMAAVEKGATTPILPGEITVTANVQVIYQFS